LQLYTKKLKHLLNQVSKTEKQPFNEKFPLQRLKRFQRRRPGPSRGGQNSLRLCLKGPVSNHDPTEKNDEFLGVYAANEF
jgi:hypothetical protein